MKLILVLCLFSFSYGNELTFKNKGEFIKKYNLRELQGKIETTDKRVFEPHESKNRIYTSFDFNKLMTLIYQDSWKSADEVLFTCSDGYQPSIPVDEFKKYDSFLAYGIKNTNDFFIANKLQNEKRVPLGPYYLIWDNIKDPDLRHASSHWAYQIVSIDLIDFKTKFPNLAPPTNSEEPTKQGFLIFRNNCMTCHGINGEGGKKGPDLNAPKNVSEYMSEDQFSRWIKDPQSVKPKTTMPPLNFRLKNRDQAIKDLYQYLKAMKKN